MQNAAFAGARATLAIVLLAIAGGAGGCQGCNGCGSGPTAAATASASGKVVDRGEQPLVRALDDLDIHPDQAERIRAIKAALEGQNKLVRDARGALSIALADCVRKNNIDRAALAPRIEAVKAAARSTQSGMQRAFDDLHRTLDAGQRKRLLATMKQELTQRSNAGRGEGRFRMDEVGTEIGLSPEQITTIRAKIKDHMEKLPPPDSAHERRPVGQQLRAFAAAFESDTFDGSSFDLGGDTGVLAERGAEFLIASTEAALPELTPDQRNKLADKLAERGHKLD